MQLLLEPCVPAVGAPCAGLQRPASTLASLTTLPHPLFSLVQRLPEQLRLQPYVVHGTFQFSGTPGKRNRMREALLWNVRQGGRGPWKGSLQVALAGWGQGGAGVR